MANYINYDLASDIIDDAMILLERALLGKQVYGFGEDGLGEHGRSYFAQTYEICALEVILPAVGDDDDNVSYDVDEMWVELSLTDYDAELQGHLMTDRNFKLSIDKLLKAADIDTCALTWPKTLEGQERYTVRMKVNANALVCW